MAAHRFWRLAGFSVAGNGPLELSEARLYAGGAPADADATLTCTLAPASGALADLRDGLATGVVSWPRAAHTSPGFALVWDLGVGGAADINGVILGAGGSAASFPDALLCQYSDDYLLWATPTGGDIPGVIYPGPNALTLGNAGIDPYADKVVARLRFDGSLNDDTGRLWTPGRGSLSYVDALPGMMLSKPQGYACAHSESIDFGSADFTIEITVDLPPAGGGASYAWMLTQDYAIPGFRDWQFLVDVSTNTVYAGVPGMPITAVLTAGRHHLAWCRSGTVSRLFVDGVPVASGALSGALGSTARLSIGPYLGGDSFNVATTAPFLIDELRITKGVARYAGSYAAGPFEYLLNFMPIQNLAAARLRCQSALLDRMPGAQLLAPAASGHLREHAFFDAYHGGQGIIYGTVKEQHAPADTPWRRRVLLIDECSRLTVRETWSDTATGAYEFRGIREGVKYTVLSYDHTGQYGAAVGDNITPEIINVA
jgi:hypothetical protein